jgi:uncharacterized protein YdcH (DUF465 family)
LHALVGTHFIQAEIKNITSREEDKEKSLKNHVNVNTSGVMKKAMESTERELVELVSQSNPHVRRLWDEHRTLDEAIRNMESQGLLTEKRQLEVRQLKKRKMRGKENLLRLIESYRSKSANGVGAVM